MEQARGERRACFARQRMTRGSNVWRGTRRAEQEPESDDERGVKVGIHTRRKSVGETGEPRHHYVERAGAYVFSLCRCDALLALRGELQHGDLLLAAPFILSSRLLLPYLLRPGWDPVRFGPRTQIRGRPSQSRVGCAAWVSACGCPGEWV